MIRITPVTSHVRKLHYYTNSFMIRNYTDELTRTSTLHVPYVRIITLYHKLHNLWFMLPE